MEAAEREAIIEQVAQSQRQLVRTMLGAIGPSWVQLDLPIGQLKALAALVDGGSLPVGQLGAVLGVGKPAATMLVDALVRRDLVVRSEDPDDRRRSLVRLSERGEEFVSELRLGRRDRHQHLIRWLGRLDDRDLVALQRGLRALLAAAAEESQVKSV
jgi:DNA-binding MarR family transcriptional regulator